MLLLLFTQEHQDSPLNLRDQEALTSHSQAQKISTQLPQVSDIEKTSLPPVRNEQMESKIAEARRMLAKRLAEHLASEQQRCSLEEQTETQVSKAQRKVTELLASEHQTKSIEARPEPMETESSNSGRRSTEPELLPTELRRRSTEEPLRRKSTELLPTELQRSTEMLSTELRRRSTEEPLSIIITEPVSPVPTSAASDLIMSGVSVQPALPNTSTITSALLSPPLTSSSLSPVEVRPYGLQQKPDDVQGTASKMSDGKQYHLSVQKQSDAKMSQSQQGVTADHSNLGKIHAKTCAPLEEVVVPPQNPVDDLSDDSNASSDLEIVSITPSYPTNDSLNSKDERSMEATSRDGAFITRQNPASGKTLSFAQSVNASSAELKSIRKQSSNSPTQRSAAKENTAVQKGIYLNETINRTKSKVIAPNVYPFRSTEQTPGPVNIVWRPNQWESQSFSEPSPTIQVGSTQQPVEQSQQLPRLQPAPPMGRPIIQGSVPAEQSKQLPTLQPSPHVHQRLAPAVTSQASLNNGSLQDQTWMAQEQPKQLPVLQPAPYAGVQQGSKPYVQQQLTPAAQSNNSLQEGSTPYAQQHLAPAAQNNDSLQDTIWVPGSVSATDSAHMLTTNTSNSHNRQTATSIGRPVAEVSPQSRTNPPNSEPTQQSGVLPVIISVHSLNPDAWKKQ